MKKAKLMMLLYFLHQEKKKNSRDNLITYARLYRDLPLAASTIRGIVQEFLNEQLIRRVGDGESVSLNLTRYGIDLCAQTFWLGFDSETMQMPLLLSVPVIDSHSKKKFHLLLSSIQFIQIDERTYMIFAIDERTLSKLVATALSHKPFFIQPMSASEKTIMSFWFLSTKGARAQKQRQLVNALVRQLVRQRTLYSPLSQRVRNSLSLCLAEMISAFRMKESIPELYYPQDMRLERFLSQIWPA